MKLTPVNTGIKLEPIKKPTPKPIPKKPAPPPKKQLSEVEKALIQLKELLVISTAKTTDLVETNASILRKTLEQLNKRQKIEFNPEIILPPKEKKTIQIKITKRDRRDNIKEITAKEL